MILKTYKWASENPKFIVHFFVFFWRKKIELFFFFRIQNIVISSQTIWQSHNLQTVYFRIKTKDLVKELSPKLAFVDFWWFWQNFWFLVQFGAHFWIFKIMGNRQIQKNNFFHQVEKCM